MSVGVWLRLCWIIYWVLGGDNVTFVNVLVSSPMISSVCDCCYRFVANIGTLPRCVEYIGLRDRPWTPRDMPFGYFDVMPIE